MLPRFLRRLPAWCALGWLSVGSAAGAQPDSFAVLPATDILRVRAICSVCCAGTIVQEFTFRRGEAPTLAAALVEREYSPEKVDYADTGREELGETALGASDLRGLDEYLCFCRADRPRECARIIQLTVTQERAGKVVATETLWDTACGPSFPSGVVSFWDFLSRLQKKS